MSKSRDKRRLLLDDEELIPKADAWDIFYGKKPTPAVQPAEPLSPPTNHDNESRSDVTLSSESTYVDDAVIAPASLPVETPPSSPFATETEAEIIHRPEPITPIVFRAQKLTRVQRDGESTRRKPNPTPRPATITEKPVDGLLFDDWVKRWSPWLKRGATLKVCRIFFNLTYGAGREECFTSNTAIMKEAGLSRSQCIRNIHHLVEIGFLDVIGAANDREAKGTHYRFNLTPRTLEN